MGNSFRNIGVKEIAEEAGVSKGTVDRVLHKRNGVSPATRLKVEKIIEKYNYEPNILAQRLALKRNIRLASLLPNVSTETEYWEMPLAGIVQAEKEISHYGIKIDKYFYGFNDGESFNSATKEILSESYQGIIIAPTFIKEAQHFCSVCDLKCIPYVFIDTNIKDANSMTYIGPNLFKSGYAVAHLLDYIVKDTDLICLVNIFKYAATAYDAEEKENGFRFYFKDVNKKRSIKRLNIENSDNNKIESEFKKIIKKLSPKVIIVMNSRAFHLGKVMDEIEKKDIIVIGYDYTERNLNFLIKGNIDFLICQRSKEQGYQSVMALYNKLIKGDEVKKINYTSIDIVTKENYELYKN